MFLESYLHYYSKNVLKNWFKGDPLSETKNIFNNFTYKENKYNNYNILFEYAIVKNNEYDSINYSWTDLLGDGVSSYNPTYEQLRKLNINVISVVDMVVMDKDKPKYYFEVKNTNPVSSIKLNKLKRLGMKNLYQIDASWIMKQCGIPTRLNYQRLI